MIIKHKNMNTPCRYKHLLIADISMQVLLITVTITSLYSSIPVRLDSAHTQAAK